MTFLLGGISALFCWVDLEDPWNIYLQKAGLVSESSPEMPERLFFGLGEAWACHVFFRWDD